MPNPDLIPVPFAQDGDKNPIPLERIISDPSYRATWLEGFPPDTRIPEEVGGEAPDGLDFNGLFNALSQAVVFLQKGNAYQFDASLAPYPIGATVRSNDNLTTYQSTVPSNSNDPNSNITGWRVYNSSSFIADNLTTDDSAKALSAKMGKKLQDEKFAIANLVNDLTTGGVDKALTAEAAKLFFEKFAGGESYIKIPNASRPNQPWIIQWGKTDQTANTQADKPLNIAFPTTQVAQWATFLSDLNGSNYYSIGISSSSSPKTNITVTVTSSLTGVSLGYTWFAIGY